MKQDFFTRAAWYLTSATDTLSIPEWRKVIEDTFTNLASGTVCKKMQLNDAKAEIFHMTQYWCVEVGNNYRGQMAANKFKRCYRWDDYYDAKNDPEKFVENQFSIMVATKKTVDVWIDVLDAMPSVSVEDVWLDPRTREGMRLLTAVAQKRYKAESHKFEDMYAKLACTLTSRPIILMEQRSPYWFRDLKTLRTEGPLITELIYRHGDGLIGMKRDMMVGGERF